MKPMKLFSGTRGALTMALVCLLTLSLHQMEMARVFTGKFQLRGGDREGAGDFDPAVDPAPAGGSGGGIRSAGDSGRTLEASVVVPECARGVFVTLRKEGEGERPDGCRGMLVRDDIILTTAGCARFQFTFDFPDKKVGRISAAPLKLLAEKRKLIDPRLGFLKADAPKHYYFEDHPVMRTRMFLSEESSPAKIDGFGDGAVVMACDGEKPIAHNFPAVGELVPLGHPSKVLPDDVLWKERDIQSAPSLSDDTSRWWTRRVSLKDEENTFQRILEEYRGPPGSVSIPTAHVNGPISQAGGLAEAIDPRGHRRQNCFKNYYFRWRNAPRFSGQRFFDWLDYGEGKDVLERNETREMIVHDESDAWCVKEEFNTQQIHYFDDHERAAHEVYLTPSEDGKNVIVRYKATDKPLPPNDVEHPFIYVWDVEKRLYIVDDTWDEERFGEPKHTAVLAGRPALSAGMSYFGKNGRLRGLDFASGHYRPGYPALAMMHKWMKDGGFDVTSFAWIGRTMWEPPERACLEGDWGAVDIPGFTAATLRHSCHEVTSGKAYVQREDGR